MEPKKRMGTPELFPTPATTKMGRGGIASDKCMCTLQGGGSGVFYAIYVVMIAWFCVVGTQLVRHDDAH